MNKFGFGFLLLFVPLFTSLIFTTASLADSRPFQASLTPDIAVHDRSVMIEGVALSIWGENPQKALALGFVNGSTGESAGFSWGLVNYADSYTGVHWACVNFTKGNFLGWQHGFINYIDHHFKGLQTGGVNYAGQLNGVQLGLLNYAATTATGLQIGLVNLIPENQWFSQFPDSVAPLMVFLNWRF